VLFIDDELAKKRRPLLTICKEMADEFGMNPRTMVRIYETRKERTRLWEERSRVERNRIAAALRKHLDRSAPNR
jgi:hypothetical protein